MPDEIENLFSLMDFAHNGKISEQEFLAATGHYRCHMDLYFKMSSFFLIYLELDTTGVT